MDNYYEQLKIDYCLEEIFENKDNSSNLSKALDKISNTDIKNKDTVKTLKLDNIVLEESKYIANTINTCFHNN